MHDDDAAAQPDPGPRRRHPRRWRAWWRRGGARRTVLGHGPGVGADRFDPSLTDFMGDTAWLIGQPVPVASLGDAVMDVSSCLLPAWPWAPTSRRKDSRPLHPTAPHADRRRLQRTSGAGRGRPPTRQSGHPGGSRTHTLSGASDTPGGDSGEGDGPAGSDGADSPSVGVAQPQRGRVSPPPPSPPVSPAPLLPLPVDPWRTPPPPGGGCALDAWVVPPNTAHQRNRGRGSGRRTETMAQQLTELVEHFCNFQRKQRGRTDGGVKTYQWILE